MTPRAAGLRRRGRPTWLFRQLSQGRFILRLFLLGLLLLLAIGFTGALQSELAGIGAGQTELAYTVASLRNAASLAPIRPDQPYQLATTGDALLQRYFSLEGDQGVLALRDGLKSLSPSSNPLSSFPVQIVMPPLPHLQASGEKPRAISFYIHLLSCDAYLALPHPPNRFPPPPSAPLPEADRILRCALMPAALRRAATLKEVEDWIGREAAGLLPSQRLAYQREARDILSLPPGMAWAGGSAPVAGAETPVWRIFLLQDKADPGLELFRVLNGESTPAPSVLPSQGVPGSMRGSRELGRESIGGVVLRYLDQVFLAVLQLRYPVLIGIGILLPMLALIMRQRVPVVRRCLEPYLLLIFAQVVTLLAAEALMGEGLMIWVGFVYTVLRLLQLIGLLWMSRASDDRLRRLFDLGPRPWLRNLLRLELLLWSLNALGLGWHIVRVFRDFSFISPA